MKRKQLRITGFLLTICMILGTIFPVLAEAENTSLEISSSQRNSDGSRNRQNPL